ncbi:MAG: helix-turn-helix transcriptional regulator, partial [Mesorhizobium sp.]
MKVDPATSPDVAALEAADADKAKHVGERIKAIRTARRISLRQLADMIGTTASFISQLERNLSGASASTLMRIAAALDLGINDLFEQSEGGFHKVLTRAD